MELKILLLTLLLSTGLIGTSYADLKDGRDAYNKGDYKTAIKEYKASANQGFANAQHNLALIYANG